MPYGRGAIEAVIPEENLLAVLHGRLADFTGNSTQEEIVGAALANPIASQPLHELAKGKRRVVILSSDHTRPVPSGILMPALLREIRKGNPNAEISILIATGCHRATTKDEMLARYGEEIVEHERILVHDCDDVSSLTDLGPLPSGNRLIVNNAAAEADLLLAEGFIEPHFFAGFSGGRKSLLPGVCARGTVMFNHCAANIDHPNARTGVTDQNPIHEDMLIAAKKAGLSFILNVVLNGRKEIVGAFCGDLDRAHRAGVDFLSGLCRAKPAMADIVIATNGGYPLDQNVYQSVKGMSTAEATCRPGGVIIMVSQCEDGHGGQDFYDTFAGCADNASIMDAIRRRCALSTLPDQWQSQIFLRILQNHHVIFVSDAPREMIKSFHMRWAPDVSTALADAFELIGNPKATVTVIPDAVSTLI